MISINKKGGYYVEKVTMHLKSLKKKWKKNN